MDSDRLSTPRDLCQDTLSTVPNSPSVETWNLQRCKFYVSTLCQTLSSSATFAFANLAWVAELERVWNAQTILSLKHSLWDWALRKWLATSGALACVSEVYG